MSQSLLPACKQDTMVNTVRPRDWHLVMMARGNACAVDVPHHKAGPAVAVHEALTCRRKRRAGVVTKRRQKSVQVG